MEFNSIATALAEVARVRAAQAQDSALLAAVSSIKRQQSKRFAYSYADILTSPHIGPAAQFFLTELYSDRDFAERDTQFARIAGGLTKLFPQQVSATALALARLHALSEQLDDTMARSLLASNCSGKTNSNALPLYVQLWRSVGQRPARDRQLTLALQLGAELDQLTRIPGLRTLLRIMRRPATAAGLSQLQVFLERGFDTFAAMHRSPQGASEFLRIISVRERAWIDRLFGVLSPTIGVFQYGDSLWPELELILNGDGDIHGKNLA